MRVGGASDTGRVRKANEDAYWFDDRLLIVADGMGGHAAGEVAASVALNAARAAIDAAEPGTEPAEEIVRRAVTAANLEVYQRACQEPRLHGMGTTLTLAWIAGGRAVVGHVGDSRAYHLTKDGLVQLTQDHSVVAELVRSGGLRASEAHAHPYRNLLTRALGAAPAVEADVSSVRLEPGEALLLCTDGLTAVVQDDEIYRTLLDADDPGRCAQRLIELANARGGPDNVTAIVAWMEAR